MSLLQLPDTHEIEEETVEPDFEGKHCLYQTEQCEDFGFSSKKQRYSKMLSKHII